MVDKALGVITLVILITALSVVLSRRAQTASVLNSLFSGIAKLQSAATAPLK